MEKPQDTSIPMGIVKFVHLPTAHTGGSFKSPPPLRQVVLLPQSRPRSRSYVVCLLASWLLHNWKPVLAF